MAGGYVFQSRDYMNTKTMARDGQEPKGSIPAEGFRGFHLDLGSTNLLTHQETYSFRTNRYSDPADDLSGLGIRNYYLKHGIPLEYDTGHDFYTTRSWTTYSHRDSFVSSASGAVWARGCISAGAPPVPTITPINTEFYGNRAIARTSPTSSNANIAVTSAEIIREKGIALPGSSFSAWLQSRALFYRSIGKEYLNVAFGWAPFISDLTKVLNSILNMGEEIRKYSALSQTEVRRRYDFQPLESTSTTESDFGNLNVGSGSNIGSWDELYTGSTFGKLRITDYSSQRIYFVGSYWYNVNPGDGIFDRIQAFEQFANKLLGLRITPEVLWELAPWSWLADYFVDVQSAIKAAGFRSNDQFNLRYAYLMRETHAYKEYTVSGINFINGPRGPFTSKTSIVKKERVKGTPFGFGVNLEGITANQWAVLAALAISKGPRKLPKLPQGEPTE